MSDDTTQQQPIVPITREERLHRISDKLLLHVEAMLDREPGSLNGHALAQVLALLKQAGVTPADVDRKAAAAAQAQQQRAARAANGAAGSAAASGAAGAPSFNPTPIGSRHDGYDDDPDALPEDYEWEDDPTIPEHIRRTFLVDRDGNPPMPGEALNSSTFRTPGDWLRAGVDVHRRS